MKKKNGINGRVPGGKEWVKTITEVAQFNRMPYQRVYRAYTKGAFKANGKGLYNAKEAGMAILVNEANAPGGDAKAAARGVGSMWHDRLRQAQAEEAEMNLAVLRKEMMPVVDHINEQVSREIEFKDRFLGLPRAIAQVLEGKKAAQIETILNDKIADIFKVFAKGGKKKVVMDE